MQPRVSAVQRYVGVCKKVQEHVARFNRGHFGIHARELAAGMASGVSRPFISARQDLGQD